jgi:plastocyanin
VVRRGRVILVATFLALAGAGAGNSGTTRTTTITITQFGFLPQSVEIAPGDTVVWRNFETVTHQVVADDGSFLSPVLSAGQSFSFTFRTPRVHGYRDSVWGKYHGTVTVSGPSARSVTLATVSPTVVYGGRVTLSGTVSSGQPGEDVAVLARPFGRTTFARIAIVNTAARGRWSYAAKPAIGTTFRARWSKETSGPAVVDVRPRVTLSVRRGVFSTTARAVRSFERRLVLLQRRSAGGGEWVSMRRIVLGDSPTRFRTRLPQGWSLLRVLLPQGQAGPGYLAGLSPTLSVHR